MIISTKKSKKDIYLAAISGSSDIVSCFMLDSPTLAVHCTRYGYRCFFYLGKLTLEKVELVCKNPVSSMLLYFFGDVDGKKMHKADFSKFTGVWLYGDYMQKTKEGRFMIYGRSDTTLHAGGVHIGTAGIYCIVEKLPEVEVSIVIGPDWSKDTRIIIFVKLAVG